MVMGELAEKTQVVVIGGGPGGYTAAIRAAQLGKQVLLVEKENKLGGICLHQGCIPSKSLIHSSNFAYAMKNAEMMGIKTGKISINLKKMQQWKNEIITTLAGQIAALCRLNKIELLQGVAEFVDTNHLRVGGEVISFEHAIIATGAKARQMKEFPYDDKLIISAGELLMQTILPKNLLVVGGGYIGLELGTVYAKLGSKVTIVEIQDHLLPGYDAEAVAVIQERLEKLGVDIFTSSSLEKKGKHILIKTNGKTTKVVPDVVLVSIGSIPNTSELSLETTRVELDGNGYIKVNEKMQTREQHIFAIGDCVGTPMLAHKAFRQGKVAAEVVAGLPSAFDNLACPAVLFTDPEIAVVGMSQEESEKKGYSVNVGKFRFTSSARAMTLNDAGGFVKIIADANTAQILGVTIVGTNASELISEACLAIEMGASLEDLAYTIHQHPTLSESLMEAAEGALNIKSYSGHSLR